MLGQGIERTACGQVWGTIAASAVVESVFGNLPKHGFLNQLLERKESSVTPLKLIGNYMYHQFNI